MRVLAIGAATVLLFACTGGGVGTQPTPTRTPTAPPTTAAPATESPRGEITFETTLSAANEVPPVTGPEASGSGDATVIIRTARSGGQVSAATAEFRIELSGFPPGTIITGAHIHTGSAGENGGVLVNTGITGDEPLELTDGSGTIDVDGIVLDPTVAADILANPAAFYVNVHSTNNPGGVVRGQLE